MFEDGTGGSTNIPHPTQWFTLERFKFSIGIKVNSIRAGRDLLKYSNLHRVHT